MFRLMGLSLGLLQPDLSGRLIWANEGTVVAAPSIQRGPSDGLETPCGHSAAARISRAIDTHDREIIIWVTTQSGGIYGEMAHDIMFQLEADLFSGKKRDKLPR